MAKEIQTAAFEGGELHLASPRPSGREAVLALPLDRLIARMVRVAPGEDPAAVAAPILKAASPFPDEDLTVSCETMGEAPDGTTIVLAAALPEGASDDIAEALDAANLVVTRIDALVLGQLRASWDRISQAKEGRRLVRVKTVDCTTLVVLDGDRPASIRAVAPGADMKLEETLCLLEAEDFDGPAPLVVTVDLEPDGPDEALAGVALRTAEEGSLNALPASWREMLDDTRFKSKMAKSLIAAGTIWALAMATLFGVPAAYGFMADRQKQMSRRHARAYREVVSMKERVEIVSKYSDRTLGALEIMKAVSDRLPAGVTLTSWNYKRGDSLRISGEAPLDSSELALKEAMESLTLGAEGDGGGEPERVFKTVRLGNTSESKGMRRFTLELGLKAEEDAR